MTPFGHIDDDFDANIGGETDADFLESLQGDQREQGELNGTVEMNVPSTLPDFAITPQELRTQHRRKTSTVLEFSEDRDESRDL